MTAGTRPLGCMTRQINEDEFTFKVFVCAESSRREVRHPGQRGGTNNAHWPAEVPTDNRMARLVPGDTLQLGLVDEVRDMLRRVLKAAEEAFRLTNEARVRALRRGGRAARACRRKEK